MARLVIVVDSPNDPTTTDPHDVAEAIVETFNESADRNASYITAVGFVSAEWED